MKTKQENARMLLKFVIPFWGFNALLIIISWFARSWTEHNSHWSADAWEGLLITWIFVKIFGSIGLVVLITEAYFGEKS